ncbi:unnamed protein product, partial [Owenia fusiformis]
HLSDVSAKIECAVYEAVRHALLLAEGDMDPLLQSTMQLLDSFKTLQRKGECNTYCHFGSRCKLMESHTCFYRTLKKCYIVVVLCCWAGGRAVGRDINQILSSNFQDNCLPVQLEIFTDARAD